MHTITNSDLYRAFIALGIPSKAIVEPSDAVYRPFQFDWLMGDYHRWFMRTLTKLDIAIYSSEDQDCDDFADLFIAFAKIAHRRTMKAQGLSGAAMPIGRFNFLQRPTEADPMQRGKHAIAWAYTDRGLVFPEPQVVGQVFNLTPEQIRSCTRCSD